MANTLTAVLDTLYSANINVARELVGIAKAAKQDFDAQGAALNQTINVPVAPVATTTTFTPGAAAATGTDSTPTTVPVVITKSKKSTFNFTGEEEKSIISTKPELFRQMVEQRMRALANEVELDGFNATRVAASRAYGTAGTTPFASDLSFPAQLRKILDDNGAPVNRRKLVIDTTAGANMRTLPQLTKAQEAGTQDVRAKGVLIDIHGFSIMESGQISVQTKGTGASYTSSAAGFASGSTTIALITGTGTVLAGDSVTFAGDLNKYVINTGVAAPGNIVVGAPGLRAALAASAIAMTVGNNYTPNLAFQEDAVVLVARPPALASTAIMSVEVIGDPTSGLPFLVARIEQYGMITYEVHLAWGWKVVQPEYVAIGLG